MSDKIVKEIIEALNLPKRLKHESINLFDTINPLPFKNNLLIYGKAGTGKTIQALNILIRKALSDFPNLTKTPKEDKEFLKRMYFDNFPCAYINLTEFLHSLRNKIRNPERNTSIIVADDIIHYQQIDYLLIDDIGVEKQSNWVYEILYLLINHRYNNYKQTIITSNINPDELIDKFGDDRIISRILDNSELIHKTKNYRGIK